MTNGTTRVVELPKPKFPMITRVITYFDEKEGSVMWVLAKENPMTAGMKVVRMFAVGDNVEIYSTPEDTSKGYVRHLIPMASVRLVEEAMPLDIFIEEMTAAEADYDDDEEGEDPEEEISGGPAAPVDGSVTS